MPATPARIGFITNEFRKVVATTSAAQTRYGALARETEDPIETFFDAVADAQTVADERQALLSAERRRFKADVTGLTEALALNTIGAVPLGRYRDTERNADRQVLVSEIVFELATERASFTVWG